MDGAQPCSLSTPPTPGPLRVLSHEGQRYLCFCSGGAQISAPIRLHVTDGCEFWRGDVFPDQLDGPFPEKGQDPSQDSTSKLREILARQEPTLTIRGATATVQFQTGRQGLTFDLSKAPLPEARKQLQDLMFGLVEQLQALEKSSKEGAIATNPLPLSSPEKNTLSSQILFAPGISPPKSKGGAGQTSTKKRLPGESLINPGFKRKKIPTGVDFEDP
uniref:Protein PAXX isoform X2 n=1 Tax=Pogona vitticeps TaxID=103695 RepID=A0ABM5F6T8_9SAUR